MRAFGLVLVFLLLGMPGCVSTSSTTTTATGSPFCPSTKIQYTLNRAQAICIAIYDVNGNFCDTVLTSVQEKGAHELALDVKNYQSGVYFLRLTTEDTVLTHKVLLLK